MSTSGSAEGADTHFELKPSIIAERFQFHKRTQNAGESIASYIAELRRLAARCSFPREYLDDTLRDRFVCGLRSENIQKQLLAEKYLTMTGALEKAQNLETAHRNDQVLKGQAPTLAIGNLTDKADGRQFGRTRNYSERSNKKPCYRCGGSNNSGQDLYLPRIGVS